jgi:glucokinase
MSGLFAGVDLGGTNIKAAIADASGTVLAESSVPTQSHEGPRRVVDRAAQLVEQLMSQAGVENAGSLEGLGIGLPGLVDARAGQTRFLPNLPTQWRDTPVAAWLSSRFGCPVRLLNDARVATLGELRFGHGRDDPKLTMAFFAIGTGVGGGVVIEGKLRLGPFGAAGELGHQTVLAGGPRCGCGNHGCLEALASGPAIAAAGMRLLKMGHAPRLYELVAGSADRVGPREMLLAAEQGDAPVKEALEQAASYIGIAAANLVTILHPDLIVIGGGVSALGDVLLDPVRKEIRERVGMFPTSGVRIERSLLGTRAGVMGAIALAHTDCC